MGEPIIKIENLSKKYRLGQIQPYYSLRDQISALFDFKKPKREREEFWALRNINLEIQKGESIGIIGRNGAGKSTLLKILSQITPPTTGKVSMRGRVSSLLEVGTGFHPELSGRENIYLNGAILGMTRAEINKKFDEIVAFSEIEKFLDTPVKRYSSGMYVRLAFAVAAHLEPEILIVDEVLAVGDIQFQKKCLGKMEDVSAKEGRTVLFVSHNMGAVNRLCQRALLLDEGYVVKNGPTDQVITYYLDSIILKRAPGKSSRRATLPGDNSVTLRSVSMDTGKGSFSGVVDISEKARIQLEYEVLQNDIILVPSCRITNFEGVTIFQTGDYSPKKYKKGIYKSSFVLPDNLLNEGTYSVLVAFTTPPAHKHIYERDALIFQIGEKNTESGMRKLWGGNYPGVIRPSIRWETKKVK